MVVRAIAHNKMNSIAFIGYVNIGSITIGSTNLHKSSFIRMFSKQKLHEI
jgi:GTP-binding protein EngB required for normal cell division